MTTTHVHRRALGIISVVTALLLVACRGGSAHNPAADGGPIVESTVDGGGNDRATGSDAPAGHDANLDSTPPVLQVPPGTPVTMVAPGQMRPITLAPPTPAGNPCGWLGVESASSAVFTPDGKLLVTAADALRVYDARTGALVRAFSPGRGTAAPLTMSSDGSLVAAVTGYPTVYRIADGATMFAAPPEPNAGPVALSPDGTVVSFGVSGASNTATIETWSIATGQRTRTLTISSTSFMIEGLAYAPRGDLLAVGLPDGHLQLWSVATGLKTADVLIQVAGTTAIHVGSLSFSPDGAYIGAVTDAGSTVLRVPSLAPLPEAVYKGTPVFSPDSTRFAVQSFDGSGIDIHSLAQTPAPVIEHLAPSRATALLAFSPADDHVALGGTNALAVQALGTSQLVWSADGDQGVPAFAPDASGFYGINHAGELRSWDALGRLRSVTPTPFAPRAPPAITHSVASFDISRDRHRLAALASFNVETVSLDELSASTPLVDASESGVPYQIQFAPDGAVVLTFDDVAVTEWGALDARRRRVFERDPMAIQIFDARVSPDGALLTVGGPVLDLWRRSDGTVLHRLVSSMATGSMDSLAFSPSGTTLATCDSGGTLSLWDTASWTIRVASRPFSDRCRVAVTADGQGVVTWSEIDEAVRLWSAADLSPVAAMPAYGLSRFVGVAATSDGQQVAGVEMNDNRNTFLYCLPPVL
jgi:WD40 repeat protein